MFVTTTAIAVSVSQRKQRVWPPRSLYEPPEAKRLTPLRWQRPRRWSGADFGGLYGCPPHSSDSV